MGVSTDGQICFGVFVGEEDEIELPWNNEEFDGDIETWWIYKVQRFKHSIEVFDKSGNYLPSFNRNSPEVEKYFEEFHFFKTKCLPCPVEPVNCCSSDYPSWILAVPSTVITAERGRPKAFDVNNMRVDLNDIARLEQFCKKFGIEYEEKPQWYLSSYWG